MKEKETDFNHWDYLVHVGLTKPSSERFLKHLWQAGWRSAHLIGLFLYHYKDALEDSGKGYLIQTWNNYLRCMVENELGITMHYLKKFHLQRIVHNQIRIDPEDLDFPGIGYSYNKTFERLSTDDFQMLAEVEPALQEHRTPYYWTEFFDEVRAAARKNRRRYYDALRRENIQR